MPSSAGSPRASLLPRSPSRSYDGSPPRRRRRLEDDEDVQEQRRRGDGDEPWWEKDRLKESESSHHRKERSYRKDQREWSSSGRESDSKRSDRRYSPSRSSHSQVTRDRDYRDQYERPGRDGKYEREDCDSHHHRYRESSSDSRRDPPPSKSAISTGHRDYRDRSEGHYSRHIGRNGQEKEVQNRSRASMESNGNDDDREEGEIPALVYDDASNESKVGSTGDGTIGLDEYDYDTLMSKEPDPEAILAERRKKRAEIVAKYSTGNNTPAVVHEGPIASALPMKESQSSTIPAVGVDASLSQADIPLEVNIVPAALPSSTMLDHVKLSTSAMEPESDFSSRGESPVEVGRQQQPSRLGTESPTEEEAGPNDGLFDLEKDEQANEAEQLRRTEEARDHAARNADRAGGGGGGGSEAHGNEQNDDRDAADYNPDLDRKEDDRRWAERDAAATAAHGKAQIGGVGADHKAEALDLTGQDIANREEDEEDEEEEEEEEDEDDLFAVLNTKKPKRSRKKSTLVPVINRALDAGDTGLADNYDDSEGYYKLILGELLDNGRYHVHANLGKGMFSGVVRAKDTHSTKVEKEVAIKVIRSQESMYKAGIKEANILKKLMEADPDDKKHIIRLERTFEHRGHLCLVFESLSMNLREVVKRFGKDVGINIRAVRAYAAQMFLALAILKKCDIMHADIKPDNILVNDSKSTLKVCDLGSASDVSENDITPYLVSRFYRAPEIILGLPHDCSLDIWSIGCTLYELYTGKILFPGRTNNHMLLLMMELKGKFPHKMLKKARFLDQHFDESLNFTSVERDGASTKTMAIPSKAAHDLKSRLMPSGVMKKLKEDEAKLLTNFVDLLEKMLSLEPVRRPTPKELLNHAFIRAS